MKLHFITNHIIGCILFLALCCLAATHAAAETDEVHIGVLAKRGYEKSLEKWDATADYLNQSLPGHRFKIVPMRFDDIQVIVKNKMVDFIIVNPGIYVDLSAKYGVRRILTLVNELSDEASITQFGSVIFTLKANPNITQLSDLQDKRLSAVHQTSLGGWIMALREIDKAGIEKWDLASLSFLNTHDAVVNAVINQETDIGIVRTDTLERMSTEGKLDIEQIRIVSPMKYDGFPYATSTPLYPEWPFAQLAHTSQQLAKDVTVALLKLRPDHKAAKQAHIKGWTIPENYQPTQNLLKQLELPPFDKSLKQSLTESIHQYWHLYLPVMLMLLFLTALSFRIIRLNRSLGEHKRTLKQSQEAQIATFEQAAVGLAHVSPSGQLFNMNQRLCAITGYTSNALQHTNLMDLILKDDIALITETFDLLRLKKQDDVATQFRIRCEDGSLKWCQLTLSCNHSCDTDEKYLVAVIDDIDQYKKLEEEKQQAEHQTALILRVAGDGILGLDSEGKHTFVNPAAADILGYQIDEMIQKNSHSLWHHSHTDGSSYPESDCPIMKVLRHGETCQSSHDIFWHKDGSAITVEFIGTPIYMDEQITGAVVVFRPTEQQSTTV
ncbi:MAG: PhnD/SsuA/transferrin family substrate-binding protein [Candidatus Thiodiazotropha sp. (ex Semelilucina semeliformis)]|nr:PhnD/SsuA/transferrin family substrate-binding protein [Candidatus Thiodiazotropha sp. (ex Semelilucina semeliformis)]